MKKFLIVFLLALLFVGGVVLYSFLSSDVEEGLDQSEHQVSDVKTADRKALVEQKSAPSSAKAPPAPAVPAPPSLGKANEQIIPSNPLVPPPMTADPPRMPEVLPPMDNPPPNPPMVPVMPNVSPMPAQPARH